MLPPERTATAILPVTSTSPVISAASAMAPPGSTTSFNSENAKATAAATPHHSLRRELRPAIG